MNILKLVTVSFLLFSFSGLKAQTVEISVEVLQAFSAQAKLYQYEGSNTLLVDSAWQEAPGKYKFKFDSALTRGLYRFNVGKNISFDIVINNEQSIDIQTVVYAPNDSLKSTNSTENTVYWLFDNYKRKHKQHMWLLNSLADFYPDSASFRGTIVREIQRQERKQYDYAKNIVNQYPNLLASKIILLEQKPIDKQAYHQKTKLEQNMATIWWSDIDLTDRAILNAPAFSARLWQYVESFYSENFDKEEQDSVFIDGIDKLLHLDMAIEAKVKIREMLISGFVNSSYENVVEFLETEVFGTLPPIRQKSAGNLISGGPSIKIGDKAYSFKIPMKDGSSVDLKDLNADYKLVVFWSSWCPHCIETLPRINEIYNEYRSKGLEVIAVSLDDEDELWDGYVKSMGLDWINMREPVADGSEILYMYKVEETPMMFLLSKDLTIISRPATRRQLKAKLRKLL
jgi:thiol-disulfide isomerase/thioredoxin